MGHEVENCRKGEPKKPSQQPIKKVWRPVQKVTAPARAPIPAVQETTSVDGRAVVGFHTPIKRPVKMHSSERPKEGYSNETFGAYSYKEVAASPPKRISAKMGLFGLLETKIKNKAFHKAYSSFSNWCITTNSGYHSGGRIWIIWKPSCFRVNVLEYNAQYVHMKVDSLVDRRSFWLTMVYAFNGQHEREPLWDNLRKNANLVTGPWPIAGDFNCVLNVSERVGGNTPAGEMEHFRRCVADCGVMDVAAVGALYTWNNKQKPEERIYSRIDRFLFNHDWCDSFTDIYAHFMPEGLMDHTPCLLKSTNQSQAKRSFKYYNMWGGSAKFIPLVRENWDASFTGTPMFRLAKNLKSMKAVLKELNKECFSDIENAAAILHKQVEGLQEGINRYPTNVQKITEEYEASLKLRELAKARESFLSQKSKQQWIKDGDANSSYFHGMLKRRRNMNKVAMVEDMNGKVCDTQEQIQKAFIDYYQLMLGSSKDTKKIHRRIIAQGPFNSTNVTLIPKCDRPKSVLQFRPIACCNVVYKVISKLLCSRLYERPHASARCMFKIDLQKAYDTVEWCFVENLLEELHFPPEFKAMILQCITTTTFSLSINGEMFGYFQGKRGLRQGDPLSPLIFTLCMEYLTRTLQYASSKYEFKFHPMCKKQRLTSLMFADDVMLFSKGDANSMMLLLQSFATFSNASGLQVSASKSSAYFRNVPEQLKYEILQISGFSEGSIPFKYLDYRRIPLVGWDTICRPKDEGGLGLKDQESWNKAMVGRLVDWVATQRDSIWVHWVQSNYLKGQEWMEYKPS
ncbi:uncharacterized protein LOC141640755 [Silene latifolia]|uniref:uncharacterized protein LOC141640755 n=1 Tax=Silene latifolia TaxID=37657 RepID=UPI003D782617